MLREKGQETCLIVVDVQRDFCPKGALAVPNGDEVVLPLNKMYLALKGERGAILWTRDWHPNRTTHFAKYGGLWPKHCVQSTKGAQFHTSLLVEHRSVFSKGMGENEDAYSGFQARSEDGFLLPDFLSLKGIKHIYVGGLATDYCVKATALDAISAGFETSFLSDASRAVNINPGDGEKAVDEMERAGAKIVTVNQILSQI